MARTRGASAVRSQQPARTRVVVSAIAGAVAGSAVSAVAPWQVTLLAGWSVGAVTHVGWSLLTLWHLDGQSTARYATAEDSSRALADLLLLGAAVASLGALGVALVKASRAHGAGKAAIIAVAALSLASAWSVVHTVFALRYARTYYAERGGVDFNSDESPDYRDFAYLALTVGMTFQVSDTNVRSRAIRRIVTQHAVISYVLGAVVFAMAINVVASLLSH